MASATDLITGSLRALNVVGATETPSSADLTLGLSVLNRMVARWRLKRLLVAYLTRVTHSLTANVSAYTIGTGATINTPRPTAIERVGVIPDDTADPLLEVPLGPPIAAADYAAIPYKALEGAYPTRVHYERSFTSSLGRVLVWPVQTTSTVDLVLYIPSPLANFADLNTDYVLADGMEEALHYNLAIRLANEGFAAPISDDVRVLARDALSEIQLANVDIPVARFSRALVGPRGRGDIRTGGL
ncbi:MAG: hypothetical protein AB7Q16_18005 [Vicinamibacterales bacterium]